MLAAGGYRVACWKGTAGFWTTAIARGENAQYGCTRSAAAGGGASAPAPRSRRGGAPPSSPARPFPVAGEVRFQVTSGADPGYMVVRFTGCGGDMEVDWAPAR